MMAADVARMNAEVTMTLLDDLYPAYLRRDMAAIDRRLSCMSAREMKDAARACSCEYRSKAQFATDLIRRLRIRQAIVGDIFEE